MRRTFNVAVSLTKNDYAEFELRPPINMVSGDHGTNILKFTVYDNGLPVDLSGNIAKITCKTPSGNRQQQDMTISTPREGKMEVVLDQRFFAEGGTYLAEIQLYDPANLKVRATLPRFTYNVDASLLEENRVIANEQFSILQQMVDTVASAEERSIEALDTATRAMNIATQKGDKATEEANRAKNEADRAKNEADRAWAADFAKHVTLDSEAQQKFDFIKNGVEKGFTAINSLDVTRISINTDLTIVYDFVLEKKAANDYNLIGKFGTSANYHEYIGFHVPTGHLEFGSGNQTYRKNVLSENRHYIMILTINKDSKEAKLYFEDFIGVRTFTQDMFEFLGVNTANQKPQIKLLNSGYYNRILSIQEIQHTVSVLNNSPAIKELHTTNAEDETSILKLGSDEDHVEMASGRTLREEYMGVLKAMGKEVPSADGSPIQVPNGIEARVISGEIKGQTVKNYAKTIERSSFSSVTGQTKIDDMNNIITIDTPTEYSNCFLKKGAELLPNTRYKVVLIILENTLSGPFSINNGAHSGTVFEGNSDLPKGSTGVKEFMFTTKSDVSGDIILRMFAGVGSGRIKLQAMVVEENATTPTSYIPFGLSSTQTIISNNGQQYPIYEPTIQGKTRILKAPKDTQNWVKINADEVRDTTKFDYKLDSINGDFGSTHNVSDYVDRAKKVKVFTTKEIDLADIPSWTASSQPSYSDFSLFSCSLPNEPVVSWGKNSGLCNAIVWESSYDLNREAIAIGSNKMLQISFTKTKAATSSAFKSYLEQQRANGTPVTIRYQLATPQEVSLTDEQFKAYDAHKKVISLPFAEDKVMLNEDGSATWVDASRKVTYYGDEEWIENGQTETHYIYACTKIKTFKPSSTKVICDKAPSSEGVIVANISGSGLIQLGFEKSKFDSIEKRRTWIVDNVPTFIGELATPVITNIPKELVPTIRTHINNTLEAGGAVKAQSFKVTVPVNQIATINAELEAIKAVLNSPSNLLLSAKYVEDEFNKNNKLESEMMN